VSGQRDAPVTLPASKEPPLHTE